MNKIDVLYEKIINHSKRAFMDKDTITELYAEEGNIKFALKKIINSHNDFLITDLFLFVLIPDIIKNYRSFDRLMELLYSISDSDPLKTINYIIRKYVSYLIYLHADESEANKYFTCQARMFATPIEYEIIQKGLEIRKYIDKIDSIDKKDLFPLYEVALYSLGISLYRKDLDFANKIIDLCKSNPNEVNNKLVLNGFLYYTDSGEPYLRCDPSFVDFILNFPDGLAKREIR